MAESRRVAALCGAAGVALLALSGTALAEDKFTWSATLTGTSDYVFRGISQTDNDPTVQGAVDVGYGMFYAGVWASGLDFGPGDDAQIEVDYYGGIKPTFSNVEFDFGFIYYDYPGYSATDPEILELKAGASTSIDKLSLGVIYFYSPDYHDLEYGVIEASAGYELPKIHMFTPSVSALYGFVDDYNGGGEYSYWNAGLGLGVGNISFDFRYWDSDLSAAECPFTASTCDERFVFTASVSIP